jgi:hypothetical protein
VKIVVVVLLAGGCVPVAAWDRERLARPEMAESARPEADAFDAHVRGAREAALEPGASGGGGCGCN